MRIFRRREAEWQKESEESFSIAKSGVFFAFSDKGYFLSAPKREPFYTFIYACLLFLTKTPQNRRLFSARARAACRNEHFFSPQGAAQLSACRRIFVLIPEKICPEGGILACFFPHVFLFGAGKALPPGKQIESRRLRWLTRPASLCARDALPAYRCMAKAIFS